MDVKSFREPSKEESSPECVPTLVSDRVDTFVHHTHRRLEPRHLQLITIAGGIGSALFVLIGTALVSGGPVSLVAGMLFWMSVIWAVANFQMEITTLLPVDGGFLAHASRFVDPAFSAGVGANYFLTSAALLNYEITILNVVLGYWFDNLNPAIVISILLAVFAVLNVWNVKWYGEVEFWVAIGKILLVFGLTAFTFVTMCGGNPIHDKFGFRYWNDPTPMVGTTPGLRFQGLWSCVVFAAFSIVGPDFMSLLAGEVKAPRTVLPKAYRSTTARLLIFYGLGSLCVATICASNDPDLLSAIAKGTAGAAKSPYVIAMERLQIPYLGSIVNGAVLVSLLSAANTFVFTTSRSLHGLALSGMAPKIFRRQNRNGVPYVAVIAALSLGCLSYLQLSAGTYKVLGWWVSITTCSEILTWVVMAWTYICFDRALKAQGLRNGDFLPAKGWHPVASAYYVFIVVGLTCIFQGYTLFIPGGWDGLNFFFSYAAIMIFILITIGWKVCNKTKHVKPEDADFVTDLESLAAYEEELRIMKEGQIPTRMQRFLDVLF